MAMSMCTDLNVEQNKPLGIGLGGDCFVFELETGTIWLEGTGLDVLITTFLEHCCY